MEKSKVIKEDKLLTKEGGKPVADVQKKVNVELEVDTVKDLGSIRMQN